MNYHDISSFKAHLHYMLDQKSFFFGPKKPRTFGARMLSIAMLLIAADCWARLRCDSELEEAE